MDDRRRIDPLKYPPSQRQLKREKERAMAAARGPATTKRPRKDSIDDALAAAVW